MNEERTGLWLHPEEHIHGHFWHRYFITVNQSWWQPSNFRRYDFNLTTMSLSFSSFLVCSNRLSMNSHYEPQALEYRINWDIYTPYAVVAGMFKPHINVKFTRTKSVNTLIDLFQLITRIFAFCINSFIKGQNFFRYASVLFFLSINSVW
jgi:hypothetical protein